VTVNTHAVCFGKAHQFVGIGETVGGGIGMQRVPLHGVARRRGVELPRKQEPDILVRAQLLDVHFTPDLDAAQLRVAA
jgi:hypothetical protein